MVAFGDPRLPRRFWSKVAPQEDGCWLWTAGCYASGYGQFSWAAARGGAHRIALAVLVGPIPAGLDVDHGCHTRDCPGRPVCQHRRCVNPAHLQAMTRRENLLRGKTLPASQALRTECPRGHRYTPANTYNPNPGRGSVARACRTCATARAQARRTLGRARDEERSVSGVIRWENPPEPDPRGTRTRPALAEWSLVAAELRGRPNVWALVSETANSSAATTIREGRLAGFGPAGAFAAKCVRVGGVLKLYAQYVGEPSPEVKR